MMLMVATWKDQVLADSASAREFGGYTYFPLDSVRRELLKPSPKTEEDLACPHGVQFYDVVSGGTRSKRSAWSYEAVNEPKMKAFEHWVGFWKDVKLT